MNALIISNGSILNLNKLKEIGKQSDFILSADGGTNHCLKVSLIPNIVIGDLDSISDEALKIIQENHIPIEKFPVKKDATDTELSIDYLINKGFKDITLMGAIGSRMDHTLGNMLLLNKLLENGVKGRIINDNNTIYLVDDELILTGREDEFISVIPIADNGAVVTLTGFEYTLNKTKIDYGSTRGISNRITGDKGYIKVHEGKCLIFVSKD
jgi:thiamine pyrophosphokinase